MTFYSEMQGIASGVLKEFKQGKIELKRILPGSTEPPYSPWNPAPPTSQIIELDGTARGVGTKYIDGTLILASDLQATIAVPSVEPSMSDKVLVDGKEHAMVHIKRIPEAGTAVSYILFFRA